MSEAKDTPRISVVINTLNEESNIADCIRSAEGLADEIIVCDMKSDDRTVEIARSLGATVVFHERAGFVEPARFFAISQAQGDWVLVLDADERMCSPLKEKLQSVVSQDQCDVVCFWSLYWYFGGWVHHGGFFNGGWARFFRKAAYIESHKPDDEIVHRNFSSVREYGKVLNLPKEYFIRHYAYPTIEKYICKTLGVYARIEAEQIVGAGQSFSLLKLLWQPLSEGAGRFLLRQGFRDGFRGFVLAVLYAAYRFAVWANVWFLESEKKRSLGMEESTDRGEEGWRRS